MKFYNTSPRMQLKARHVILTIMVGNSVRSLSVDALTDYKEQELQTSNHMPSQDIAQQFSIIIISFTYVRTYFEVNICSDLSLVD